MIGVFRYKDRGPTSSRDYNERVRETSEAFIDLLGRVTAAEAEVRAMSTLTAVEHSATTSMSENLASTIETLQEERDSAESGAIKKVCTVFESRNVLSVGMDGNPIVGSLAWDQDTGMVVLPHAKRISRLGFEAPTGEWVIDPAVRTAYSFTKEDHEANEIARALDHSKATAFMVRTPGETVGDNELVVYISVPAESAFGAMVNYIELDPTPRASLELHRICYSTKPGATLDESDSSQWKDLWFSQQDVAVENRVYTPATKRYIPPQADDIETVQQDCGPRRYYFGERKVTAIKVVLRATQSYTVGVIGSEYFVGLRHIDVGHVSFSSTGKRVFEYSMPSGTKTITNVVPRLVNSGVSGDMIDGVGAQSPDINVFYKSGENWLPYTLSVPVDAISSIRLEVTAKAASNGCTPQITGFDVYYQKS